MKKIKLNKKLSLALNQLIKKASPSKNDIFILGGSSSEILGNKIGTDTNLKIGEKVVELIDEILRTYDIYLAVQGCEHINRSLVVKRKCFDLYNLREVNVVPHQEAGGSFATAAYNKFENPVMVKRIEGHFGMDIGDSFIGMHLKEVVVPVRLKISKVGKANLTAARTRPWLIGGDRSYHK